MPKQSPFGEHTALPYARAPRLHWGECFGKQMKEQKEVQVPLVEVPWQHGVGVPQIAPC